MIGCWKWGPTFIFPGFPLGKVINIPRYQPICLNYNGHKQVFEFFFEIIVCTCLSWQTVICCEGNWKVQVKKGKQKKSWHSDLMMEDGVSGISTFLCTKPWNIHILFWIFGASLCTGLNLLFWQSVYSKPYVWIWKSGDALSKDMCCWRCYILKYDLGM